MPAITSLETTFQIVESSASISIASLVLDTQGQVYAIARQIATIIQDPEDEFSTIDVTVRIPSLPTAKQVYDCNDWNGETADSCARVVVANSNGVTLYLNDLAPNSVYKVYYVVANEYPIQAIYDTSVAETEVRILSGSYLSIGVLSCVLFTVLSMLI